jgi:hypothetical protein
MPMNKETIKAFILWLENASEDEIKAHRDYILAREALITTREGKSDVRLALRLIDEELLARLESMRFG